jgi:hypothetical protein
MNAKTLLPLGLGLLCLAGMASAGKGPDPSGLPQCQSSSAAEACRLPLKNGQFDSLEGWTRPDGLPSIGEDETGNTYAALHVGAVLSQPVFAHFGASPQDVAYALRFRTRADRGAGELRASLSMSDANGDRSILLGDATTTAQADGWNDVELVVNGAAFAAPAHVTVTIANEGGSIVQVDDVTLVQAEGVEVLGR